MMIDLHDLLKNRQDELRGRPEDWIDRFGSWYRNLDVADLRFNLLMVALIGAPALLLWWHFR